MLVADVAPSRGEKIFLYLIYAVLTIGLVALLFPFFWMISSALKGSQEIFLLPPTLFPTTPRWENFVTIWKETQLARWFLNSAIHIIGVMVLQLFISALGAYALAKMKLPKKEWFLLFFIGTMMIPDEMLLIPLYNIMQAFPGFGGGVNLLNSYWALILPFSAWGYAIYLLYGFFSQLPDELLDAAKIDGASEFRTFTSIVLPLSKPALAVMSLFTFMGVWNMFLYPLIIAPSERMWTVMVGMYMLQGGGALQWNQIMAALTLASIPPLFVFLFFQKYLTQGIVMTGLKG